MRVNGPPDPLRSIRRPDPIPLDDLISLAKWLIALIVSAAAIAAGIVAIIIVLSHRYGVTP